MNGILCFRYPCCSCPHGRKGIVSIFVSALALYFCLFSYTYCNFVTVTMIADDDQDKFQVGLMSYSYVGDDSCHIYDAPLIDFGGPAFQAARVVGGIAVGLAGVVHLLLVCVATSIAIKEVYLNVLAAIMLVACLLQGLTFLVFASDFCDNNTASCTFGPSAGLAFGATLMCFLTAEYLYFTLEEPAHGEDFSSVASSATTPSIPPIALTMLQHPAKPGDHSSIPSIQGQGSTDEEDDLEHEIL